MIQYHLCLEWLPEKTFSAGRDRLILQPAAWQGGDQDHRCPFAPLAELSHQVQPARPGHADVGNDAVVTRPVGSGEERIRPEEWLGAIADGTQQIHQRGTKGFVIIDDRNERAIQLDLPGRCGCYSIAMAVGGVDYASGNARHNPPRVMRRPILWYGLGSHIGKESATICAAAAAPKWRSPQSFNAEDFRHPNERRNRSRLQLFLGASAMHLHGGFADGEFARNFLVGEP